MNTSLFAVKAASLKGIGRVSIKKLIDYFGEWKSIFNSSTEEISKISGLTRQKARSILNLQDEPLKETREFVDSIKARGWDIYCYGEKDYPELLSKIYDPPIVFYSDGNIKKQDYNCVAIVGTRRASQYGKSAAKTLAKSLAGNNITIVSGCAVGVDAAAHRGALEAGGRTIAVLGSGLDKRYPKVNCKLMEEISCSGAVISEFNPDTDPVSYNFPLRNRVISGLSIGVVVVEAPERSGALITAYQALEQGREVFSVPGSVFSAKSRGCINLIKEGALPVIKGEEVIEELSSRLNKAYLKSRER
ncbi:MAG: DNA-processing protein DprA, partial [Elusimicrobiota bacterium]